MTTEALWLPPRARGWRGDKGSWPSPGRCLPLLTPPLPVLNVMPVLRVIRHYIYKPATQSGVEKKRVGPNIRGEPCWTNEDAHNTFL